MLEPIEFPLEFRAGLRIAVRRIQIADQHAIHRSFDVARFGLDGITRQVAPNLDRVAATRENRDAVEARLLSAPHHSVARIADRVDRKLFVKNPELLQTDDIRLRFGQPFEQAFAAIADAVDVECSDLHLYTFFIRERE